MGPSLEIVIDQKGHFHHRDGVPLVVVFDSNSVDEVQWPRKIEWKEPVLVDGIVIPDTVPLVKATGGPRPLKFVNTSLNAASKKVNRKNIRSRVKDGCHAAERRPTCRSGDKSSETPLTISNSAVFKSLEEFALMATKQSPAIFINPFRQLDTFGSFPVMMEPYMYDLVSRYISVAKLLTIHSEEKHELSIPPQTWLPLAMTDSALFHTLLCGTALYADLKESRNESIQRLKHMKYAVHLISLRLQEQQAMVPDSVMIAVAHLADFEIMVGNLKNWSLHMDGLYQMVQLRGGLVELDTDIRSKIWNADLTGCIASLIPSRFPQLQTPILFRKDSLPKNTPSELPLGFKNLINLFNFDTKFINIIQEIHIVTKYTNTSSLTTQTPSNIIPKLQHSLLSLLTPKLPTEPSNELQKMLVITFILYLVIVQNVLLPFPFPLPCNTPSQALHRIKLELGALDVSWSLGLEHAKKEAFLFLELYVLFITSLTVTGSERGDLLSSFARTLSTLLTKQGTCIQNWEDFKARILLKYFWSEKLDGVGEKIWKEMTELRVVCFG